MALSTEQGFPLAIAFGTLIRGWALAAQGQGVEGIAQIRQSLAAWRATGGELHRPYFLALLAEALAIINSSGARWWEAELYRLKGESLLALSTENHDEAEAWFRQAFDLARRQQARSLELRAAMSLSQLWKQQGKRDAARQLLSGVYNWFTEGFDTVDLRDAKALLDKLLCAATPDIY